MELVVEKGGCIINGGSPTGPSKNESEDICFDILQGFYPRREIGSDMAFSSQRYLPDRIIARQSEKNTDSGTNIQRHFPPEVLREIAGRYEGDENAEVSRTTLDAHGKI